MKRFIIALLALLLCFSAVFAAEEPVIDYSESLDFSFQPTLSRYSAMGQSGLAAPGRLDSFYTNPAALASGRFGLSLPSVSFTLYNAQKIVSDETQRDLISTAVSGKATQDETLLLAEKLVKNLGNGYNLLAKVDASAGVELGAFGLGTNVQAKFHTFADGTSNLTNTTIIPEVNVAQTVAVGFNLIKSDAFKLQFGVSGHLTYKVYLEGQNAKTISRLFAKDETEGIANGLLWDSPLMGGFAIPFDVGATISLAKDAIRLSATVNNLNGTYYMKSYTSVGDFLNSTEKVVLDNVPEDHVTNESMEFRIETPYTVNVGFAFSPNIIFKPVITVDVLDAVEVYNEIKANGFQASEFLLHLNAGAELSFALFNLRAGINSGYASIGVGVSLLGVRVDAAYGWQEFGTEIGDKPVDSLTIRVNLGYDK